ncbi:MAG: hypothetical protein M3014_04465 [Chloroflexota bacterium]|nr:hypothetical protein [Chloroflexota bacterium]
MRVNRANGDENDLPVTIATALVTFTAALGVSGGTNVWMLLTGNDLIKKHRPTLTFRSAIYGDGVILPVVNCLMMRGFRKWRPRAEGPSSLVPVLGGSAVSLMFHIAQGRGGMVNWTMTRPWRWNLLGYYHFVYMATQFSYMLLYITELIKHWSDKGTAHKRDLALISAAMVAFAVLLATDYQE